jgi:hypothetical protein
MFIYPQDEETVQNLQAQVTALQAETKTLSTENTEMKNDVHESLDGARMKAVFEGFLSIYGWKGVSRIVLSMDARFKC